MIALDEARVALPGPVAKDIVKVGYIIQTYDMPYFAHIIGMAGRFDAIARYVGIVRHGRALV